MVGEPEDAVRELVVVGAVGVLFDADEPHRDLSAADIRFDVRALRGDGPVGLADRARDPNASTVAQRARQRGDEAPDAAPGTTLARRGYFVGDRPAVRNDDDRRVHGARRALRTTRDGRR